MRKLFSVALAALMFAGCSSTPTQDPAPVEERAPDAATASAGGVSTAGTTTPGISGAASGSSTSAVSPLKDPKSILSQRNIYFDYDSYVVKTEHRALVEAHAKYLQANRSARVVVQGNTDERGTREYNIALGQKRADAIKKMLLLLGATESQIETVSFGKEKPRNPGTGENAWAENRRGDIVYSGE